MEPKLTIVQKINKQIKEQGLETKPISIENYDVSDFGITNFFIDLYGDQFKWVVDKEEFFAWYSDKGVWNKDIYNKVTKLIEEFLSVHIFEYIKKIENEVLKKKFTNFIKGKQTNNGINSILKNLYNKHSIQIEYDKFDCESRYLNCINKVVDLEMLEFHDHNRKYMLSKQSGFNVDLSIKDNTWKNFLMSVMGNDISMYTYLLRTIAYSLQGNAKDDCMFILYGRSTRNGKSTLVSGLSKFFKDYGTTIQPETISKNSKTRGGGPRPDIVDLQGKRFVEVGETSKNHELNVAAIKKWTGGDLVKERPLFGNYSTFQNNGVFFVHTNTLFKVDDDTLFKSNRVIVIPFDVRFNKSNCDPDMDKKLATPKALSGLFNELLRVMKEHKNISIKRNIPRKVTDAINDFEKNSDEINVFLEECTVKSDKSRVASARLHGRYIVWCKENNIIPISNKAFTMRLKNKNYDTIHKNTGTYFLGLDIHRF